MTTNILIKIIEYYDMLCNLISWLYNENARIYTEDDDETEEYTKDEIKYINKLFKIYGNKYDYSKLSIHGKHHKVTLICPKHGDFSGSQFCMLHGKGCPSCNSMKRFRKLAKYFGIDAKKM